MSRANSLCDATCDKKTIEQTSQYLNLFLQLFGQIDLLRLRDWREVERLHR